MAGCKIVEIEMANMFVKKKKNVVLLYKTVFQMSKTFPLSNNRRYVVVNILSRDSHKRATVTNSFTSLILKC